MSGSYESTGDGVGRSAYQLYLADARRLPKSRENRRHLVESHLFYVIQVAKEYRSFGIPFEDLLSEGNVGLLEAADRFDKTRGVKFISYATWWIRKRICDLVARQVSIVRLPKYRMARLRNLRQVEAHLRALLGRQPTTDELALEARLSPSEVDVLHTQSQREVSLDAVLNPESGLRLEDVLAEDVSTQDAVLIRENASDRLLMFLRRLPQRQREVVTLHFGLGDERPLTLAEIGRRIGVSRERVRQLERQAISRLRHLLEPEAQQRTA